MMRHCEIKMVYTKNPTAYIHFKIINLSETRRILRFIGFDWLVQPCLLSALSTPRLQIPPSTHIYIITSSSLFSFLTLLTLFRPILTFIASLYFLNCLRFRIPVIVCRAAGRDTALGPSPSVTLPYLSVSSAPVVNQYRIHPTLLYSQVSTLQLFSRKFKGLEQVLLHRPTPVSEPRTPPSSFQSTLGYSRSKVRSPRKLYIMTRYSAMTSMTLPVETTFASRVDTHPPSRVTYLLGLNRNSVFQSITTQTNGGLLKPKRLHQNSIYDTVGTLWIQVN